MRFDDLDQPYVAGEPLPSGDYNVSVALLGYEPWSGVVSHTTVPTVRQVALEFVSAQYADPLSSGGVGPEMAVVPAGTFRMGCVSEAGCLSPELPVHTVTFATPFSVSRHEVTFNDFVRFARATGRGAPDDSGWGRGRRPVVNVSWLDAGDYVDWLSAETGRLYALPSEAEWEYAARANSEMPFAWGMVVGNDANCADCGRTRARTVAVGTFRPNAWGLFDVHGNVWEWVQDCWNGSYEGAPADGQPWTRADCARRVLRGGSWANDGSFARSASRLSSDPAVRGNIAGFRVTARDR